MFKQSRVGGDVLRPKVAHHSTHVIRIKTSVRILRVVELAQPFNSGKRIAWIRRKSRIGGPVDYSLWRNTELITPDQYVLHNPSWPDSTETERGAIAFGYPRVRSCEYQRVNDLWLSATCAVVNGGRWLRPKNEATSPLFLGSALEL